MIQINILDQESRVITWTSILDLVMIWKLGRTVCVYSMV